MSSCREVLLSLTEVVERLNNLLKTEIAEAAVGIAEDLGCQEQIDEGVNFITEMIGDVNLKLSELHKPLSQIAALSGLVSLIQPLIGGLGQIIVNAPRLAEVNLDVSVEGMDKVEEGLNKGRDILDGGKGLLNSLPRLEDAKELEEKLNALKDTVDGYKGKMEGE